MKRNILSTVFAGIWVTVSEFIRNEFLFKNYWITHYNSLGLDFVTLPVNGIMWMVWSFLFAYLLYRLLHHFSLWDAVCIGWMFAFLLMWITVYNLQVLPLGLLLFAVPLSILETLVAGLIIKKFY
jgi:hypothetical protein